MLCSIRGGILPILICANYFVFLVRGDLHSEMAAINVDNLAPYAALHGFTLSTETVVSEDGWLLTVHRIRNLDVFDPLLSAPVLFSTGFGCSSLDSMVTPRNESLLFLLADRGYDVWAANYRGNTFSNKMIRDGRITKPTHVDYYRATWQYMAERDFPAVLTRIYEATNQSAYLIGLSLGATAHTAFLSEHHHFDDKIQHVFAMLPLLRVDEGMSTFFELLVKWTFISTRITPRIIFGFGYGSDLSKLMNSRFKVFMCTYLPFVFATLIHLVFDRHPLRYNPHRHILWDRLPLFFQTHPSSFIVASTLLYAQQYKRSQWQRMDYDLLKTPITNEQEYGQKTPPYYDFKRMRLNQTTHFLKNDAFTGESTARRVFKELEYKPGSARLHYCHNMNHLATIWAYDARCCLYDPIIDEINELEAARGPDREAYRSFIDDYVKETLRDENLLCKRLRAIPDYDPPVFIE